MRGNTPARPAHTAVAWAVATGLAVPALAVAWSGGALAQANQQAPINSMNSVGARPVVPTATLPSTRREVAPGLPGAQTREDTVAPADRPAAEMRPTEALFDSINRGDIAASRDAIGRGAELNGRNVLGMTPLDLAVDLGRKDIVFLLLSLGGADNRPPGPPQQQAGQGRMRVMSLDGNSQVQPQAQQRRQQPQVQPARVTAAPPPAAPKSPQLFAGDGGAPSPDAGFLGFGGGSGRTR